MTPSRPKIHWLLAISCVIAGCAAAPAPLSQLNTAESQIALARELRAARYAPSDLDVAESRLQLARGAIDAKDYALAGQLIEQGQVAAELAAVRARVAQAEEAVRRKTEENARLRRQLSAGGGR